MIDVTINTIHTKMTLDALDNMIMSGAFAEGTHIAIKAEYDGEVQDWVWNGRTDHYEKWERAQDRGLEISAIQVLESVQESNPILDRVYDRLYEAYAMGEAQQDHPVSRIRAALKRYEEL